MNSLTELNTHSQSELTFTDLRDAKVVFDRATSNNQIVTISGVTNNDIPNGIEISEIINFATAACTLRFSILSNASAPLIGSTLAWPSVPAGVTLTTVGQVYTYTGISKVSQWTALKNPDWTLPANYATKTQWGVEVVISYYNETTALPEARTYYVFDPLYFLVAILNSASTITARPGFRKQGAAAVTATFTFNTDAPFTEFVSTKSSVFSLSAVGIRAKGLVSNVSSTVVSTVQPNFILNSSPALTANFSTFCLLGKRRNFVAVLTSIAEPNEPGGSSFLIGNGYEYPPGDPLAFFNPGPPWQFPGILRIRNGGAVPMAVNSTVTCEILSITFGAALVASAGTMTVNADKFFGIVDEDFATVATQSTTAIKTARAISTMVVSGGNVSVVVAEKRANAAMNSSSTMTVNETRLKLFNVSLSSQSSASVITQNSRIAGITKALNVVSSMSIIATGYAPMVLTYTIDSSTQRGGASRTVYLPLEGTVNLTVEWGDGTTNDYTTSGFKEHAYATNGVKTVKVKHREFNNQPALTRFGSILNPDPGSSYAGPGLRDFNAFVPERDFILPANNNFLTSIDKWGYLGLVSVPNAFRAPTTFPNNLPDTLTDLSFASIPNSSTVLSWDTSGITVGKYAFDSFFNQPIDSWDMSGMTDMSYMFYQASAFNQSLNSWYTGNVTTMERMFNLANVFNGNISSWNTAYVTNMSFMFVQDGTKPFNQPLNSWNVGNVTNMSSMFNGCVNFNQPLNSWNVGNVTNMSSMFSGATVFNQALSSWNVSSVTNMNAMFANAGAFNQSLNSWPVSSVTNMSSMFSGASAFNQSCNNWNTVNVTNMSSMFNQGIVFNGNITSWNTANVTNMSSMFSNCIEFGQNLNSWNVSSVTNMNAMFFNCDTFQSPLNNWNTANVTNMDGMFNNCAFYDSDISSWPVPLIPSKPSNFDLNTSPNWITAEKPNWGV